MALAALVASLALAACGGDDGLEGDEETSDAPVAESQGEPKGELTISNWAFYMDENTIPEFEAETGVTVEYSEEINSYEEFFGKMQPLLAQGDSGGRTLMVATDWLAERMYDLGYLQRFDEGALQPALDNLETVVESPNDPDHEYSIPWQSGMTGLVVNTKEAPDVTSINDLFDPKYKGKVVMITETRETPALVMKADGVDPADATEEEWMAAIDKIDEAANSGQIRRLGGADYTRDMASGDAVAAIGWSSGAAQLALDNPDIEFVMPDEGCMIWSDNWVIPVGAPNPTAGYAFINYTYEPQNAAQILSYVSSVSPVKGVGENVPELAESELSFPSEEFTENCSPVVSPAGGPEVEQQIERAWSAVISG